MAKSILIVDDTRVDAFMITRAVQFCCDLLNQPVEIEAVSSPENAIKSINKKPPDLLITDLFMPENGSKDFSRLPLAVQCKEMEYPAGMSLLSSLKNARIRRLVTTFFWNYPGFSRYGSMFANDKNIDGALPKDLFYLVGSLTSAEGEEADFAPLRILLQALSILMKPRVDHTKSPEPRMDRWHMRSLFDESSAWLSRFPHNVLDVRAEMQGKPSDATKESEDISEYAIAGPWMPAFEVEVSLPKDPLGPGIYKHVIAEIAKDDYRVHLRTNAKLALSDKAGWGKVSAEFTFDGGSVASKFPRHVPRATEIKNFLTPYHSGGDDRFLAQLLVTLGFFSYWCHLPDHRASRTTEDIVQILRDAGHSYRDASDPTKAATTLREDLELINDKIVRRIRDAWKREWWKHFHEKSPLMVIGSRKSDNQYHYWLNASLILVHPHQ
jgi:CheY-like chemotaxis protein